MVRWHPNSQYVATGSTDRSVCLWDVRAGDRARILVSHRAEVRCCGQLGGKRDRVTCWFTGNILQSRRERRDESEMRLAENPSKCLHPPPINSPLVFGLSCLLRSSTSTPSGGMVRPSPLQIYSAEVRARPGTR